MKAEPGSFHLGVIDVFSIMLPGALLAYFLPDYLAKEGMAEWLPKPGKEAETWVVFLFTSYLFGHIIFLVSSFLDTPYERWIRPYYWPDIKELTYLRAEVIKEKFLGEDNKQTVNTFQWAKAMLVLEHPEASSEVARLEAASKFFRSLVVVFAILIVLNFWSAIQIPESTLFVTLALLLLMLLSLWRYAERRHKSVKQACWYMITLDGLDKHASKKNALSPVATHAGGVVFRYKNNAVEYLLVRPKSNANEWLLPKGHIEPGEGQVEAAMREVREETGVVARIIYHVGSVQFQTNNEDVNVEFYLMEFIQQISPEEEREIAWCSPKEAVQRLTFTEYKILLHEAEIKRTTLATS